VTFGDGVFCASVQQSTGEDRQVSTKQPGPVSFRIFISNVPSQDWSSCTHGQSQFTSNIQVPHLMYSQE